MKMEEGLSCIWQQIEMSKSENREAYDKLV